MKLLDGSSQEFRREEILGLVPTRGLLRHSRLRFDALICLKGKLLPVSGPLPIGEDEGSVEERSWIMLFHSHAQVIHGLPKFDDDVTLTRRSPALVPSTPAATETPASPIVDDAEEDRILREMEEMLKGA